MDNMYHSIASRSIFIILSIVLSLVSLSIIITKKILLFDFIKKITKYYIKITKYFMFYYHLLFKKTIIIITHI